MTATTEETRALALLLRYAAALETGETLAYLTKRTIREDYGVDEATIDRAVARVQQALREALASETREERAG